jgi:hypothetical protein
VRQQEGGAAAIEGHHLFAIGTQHGHAHGMHVVLPFAG